MTKTDLLAKILIKYGDIKRYAILEEERFTNERYLKYAFCHGYPEHFKDLPAWSKELKTGEIYDIGEYSGGHWMIQGSQPISVERLMSDKYNLSVNDIWNIINENSHPTSQPNENQ